MYGNRKKTFFGSIKSFIDENIPYAAFLASIGLFYLVYTGYFTNDNKEVRALGRLISEKQRLTARDDSTSEIIFEAERY